MVPGKTSCGEEGLVRDPAIRVLMMPKDTNGVGTIFGGVILSYIDLAGAVEARRCYPRIRQLVTVAMDKVEFIAPVFVGDTVSFYGRVLRKGRTSVRVEVEVEAVRQEDPRERVRVTTAEVVYVSVHPGTNRPVVIEEGEG